MPNHQAQGCSFFREEAFGIKFCANFNVAQKAKRAIAQAQRKILSKLHFLHKKELEVMLIDGRID